MAVRFHTRSPARCTIGGTGGSAVATGMGNCNYPWLDSHTFIWFRLLPPPLLAQAGSKSRDLVPNRAELANQRP